MRLTENKLRYIIRKILIERKLQADREDGTKVIGEPDATNEPMRDNPTIDQVEDEIDEVNALGGAGIAGVITTAGTGPDGQQKGPSRHLRKNKKNEN